MPKGFSEKEKDQIRLDLIKKGKELFGKYGIRKTSIIDLTNAVGIAKGSFYIFYNSKEELLFDILEKTEKEIHKQVLENLNKIEKSSLENVKNFFNSLYFYIEDDPFIKRMMDKQEINHLWRKMPENLKEKNLTIDIDTAGNLIEILNRKGFMIDGDKEVLAGILRSLFFLMLHREEIGENIYPKVIKRLIDIVLESLIKDKN